jgi:Flp pilus assembly protein TadG
MTDMRRAVRRDCGALTLSYVIIVPVFLAMLMVMTQVALWYLARSAALAAARQGVDVARVPDGSTEAGVAAARRFARKSASGFLLGPAASPAGSTATTIVITVTGRVPSLIPSFLPALPIRISQVAQAPVERFTTP